MIQKKYIFTAGFAMFSMFFGSGNLVFPLLTGQISHNHYLFAALGFILTAVVVPFIGLFGMILFDGHVKTYFSKLGKIPAFLMIFIMLALLGPFGVVPRCITVAYGGITLLLPILSFTVFSLIFCLLIGLLIWQKNKVIDLIGLVLTPFKLGTLLLLIIAGLWSGAPIAASSLKVSYAFMKGLHQGYQTMDLLAGFFFSSTTVYYIRQHLINPDDKRALIISSSYASLIGAGLLTLVYLGFITLGARYSLILQNISPEEMLAVIAYASLGPVATPIITLTICVACLATAVILSLLFVDFFRKEVMGNKITHGQSVGCSLAITYCISLLGFNTICQGLGFVLELAYPALIVFALTNIASKVFNWPAVQLPFWIVLSISSIIKISQLNV